MSGGVALCLAAAARLELLFQSSTSLKNRHLLLKCAADCLDKTRPREELQVYTLHWDKKDQVRFLIKHRFLIDTVAPERWPGRRISAHRRPGSCAGALQAFEHVLKNGVLDQRGVSRLRAWLTPALEVFPELSPELDNYFIALSLSQAS